MTNKEAFKQFEARMKVCPRIELSEKDAVFLWDFSLRKAQRKSGEYGDTDGRQMATRNMCGVSGEFASLLYYGQEEYFDDSIGSSWSYDQPDWWNSPPHKKHLSDPCIPLEVKSSHRGNVPLVKKKEKSFKCDVTGCKGKRYFCPNLICVVENKTVWLLGLASPAVLAEYIDDELIINAKNWEKTGFYGVDHLIDIPPTWDELRAVCADLISIAAPKSFCNSINL
jgi:hypothetical protein